MRLRSLLKPLFVVAALATVTSCLPREKPTGPTTQTGTSLPEMRKPIRQPDAAPANVPVVKVAMLLPLSGESQALGQSMMDAASLALYDYYISMPAADVRAKVVLIPKDTGMSPSIAAEVANQALTQQVSLIVGPLYSQAVNLVGPIAKKAGVPVLALSNNRQVAGKGVYIFGFQPEEQVKRVADYAYAQGTLNYGVLAPNDAYGQTVTDTLTKSVTLKGGQVKPVELYAKSSINIDAAVKRLSEGYTANPFQALFIAEGGDQVKTINNALKNYGLDRNRIKLVGTGLWDDESVMNAPELVGGWFASSPPAAYEGFERRFQAAYGYKPKRLAALAYDAVYLAAELAQQSGGAAYTDAAITRPQGFEGPANGAYRLKEDGVPERGLAVLEITSRGFKVLDPAPRSFGGN